MEDIKVIQEKCCSHYKVKPDFISETQMIVISKGIYEGVVPVEVVRYASPKHMSGWWLTTDDYNGDTNSLVTVHYKHILDKRPELAIYMALPVGYRFLLGGESEHVWFDEDVASESA